VKKIQIHQIEIGDKCPLALIAGPCVIESAERTFFIAEELKKMTDELNIPLIFKASFDKANRQSIHSYRGPGMKAGLEILKEVKRRYNLPLITDIHLPEQAESVAAVCDILQIPAFLCRQTDLLVAAAITGKVIAVKKGQFMSPMQMRPVIGKLLESGNANILLTERGVCFGYNTLVSDMRAIAQMQSLGYPVCFDATHSVQQPGGLGDTSGGERQFVPLLAKAALAAGANALFMEVHDCPEEAKSDGANMLALKDLKNLLKKLLALYKVVNE
jgi:2-dehydro-3-deoxyphosphooctonate aldolase (KDO 8-P synthase)